MPKSAETREPPPGNTPGDAPGDSRGDAPEVADGDKHRQAVRCKRPKEIGGPEGPEPTRYGDWERNGRCTDF